jgi:UDP-N-acetylglucosamine 2-epimerase (non-hydrolysing)
MLIDIIAGARPNFIKIAPIIDAIRQEQAQGATIQFRLIHTGQHYDQAMSGDFFRQLSIPCPDINLNATGSTPAALTAAIMVRYEQVLLKQQPDLVLVVGDVTSTIACAVTAKKLNNIRVAHVEAGIRSGDLSMPEEINRIVTDTITDYFFTTSPTANQNLRHAGIANERIFFVGNTMIDTLLRHMPSFSPPDIWQELGLQPGKYMVMTMHRPSNVDDEDKLRNILLSILDSSRGIPLIFPAHPRTAARLARIDVAAPNLHVISPLAYLQFNYLVQHSMAVITDSGGITEETTVMNIPCLTLRHNTERPETVTMGTSELLGTDPHAISQAFNKLFEGRWKKGAIPDLWDGQTARRIVRVLKTLA